MKVGASTPPSPTGQEGLTELLSYRLWAVGFKFVGYCIRSSRSGVQLLEMDQTWSRDQLFKLAGGNSHGFEIQLYPFK